MTGEQKPWWNEDYVAPPRAWEVPQLSEEGWAAQMLPAVPQRWYWMNCERLGGGWGLNLRQQRWGASMLRAFSPHQALFCVELGPLTLELYFEGTPKMRGGRLNQFFSNKATLND